MTARTLPAAVPARGMLGPPGELTLRVHASSHDGRLVRIRSPKCTVGSAAGCTLRLRAAGVEPLHCWILRGSAGAVVRKMHGAVTLNGARFEDSPLQNGDRLRLGSVELEVVECSSPPLVQGSPFPAPIAPSPEAQELEARLTVATERISRLEGEARQGFQSSIVAADRADQLRDALAAAHQQLEEACRELAAAHETMLRQTAELDSYQRQLNDAESEEGELAQQLEQARQTADNAASELAARSAQVAEVQSRLESDTQQWQADRTQLERRLQQREAELEAVRSTSAAQTGLMTVPLSAESAPAESAPSPAANARIVELEQQLAAQRGELETLRRLVGEQSIVEGKLEHLQRDLEARSADLAAAEARCVTAAEQSRRQEELESRSRTLAQQEADLVERVARATEARQQLARDRDALEAERAQLTAEQSNAMQHTNQRAAEVERQTAELEKHIEAANGRLLELDNLRSQLGGERAALDERAHRLAQRQRDLDLKEADFEKRWTELAERGDATEQQSRELEAQRRDLERQAAILVQRSDELAQRQDQLAQQAADLVPRLEQLTAREQDLDSRLAALANMPPAGPPGQPNESSCNLATQSEPQQQESAMSSPSESLTAYGGNAVLPNVTVRWQPDEDDAEAGQPPRSASASPAEDEARLPADEPSAAEPENIHDSNKVDALVNRLVQASLWRSADGSEPPPAQSTQPQPPDEAPPTASAGASQDDESIELYMSQLLKRVRGETPRSAVYEPPSQPAAGNQSEPGGESAPGDEADAAGAGEYFPRSSAPELNTDLTAMRELANTAARSAIDRHVRKYTGRQAAGRLVSAGLTVAASLLLGYWAWHAHSVQASAGAVIGVAVGGYWTLAALRRLVGAMRLSRPDPVASPSVVRE